MIGGADSRFDFGYIVIISHEHTTFRKDYQSEMIARYVSWWSRLIWFCHSASENTFDTGLRLLQSQRQSLNMIGRILEF
jgi:hypothetical protein